VLFGELDARRGATKATTTHSPCGYSGSSPTSAPSLTDRELDVLANRYSNKEIARELFIAPATVKKHTVTLYDKLNVHGRQEAVTKARTLGYLPN
jgi:ATP/maltotriose-dependent transcriptional regulator MalT